MLSWVKLRAARVDAEDQAGHHVVADVTALVAGRGGAGAPGKGGSFAHDRGSSLEPRGRAAMQEAAAAAFRRGSRADGWNRSICKALAPQAFPPVYVMAGAGRKCITDACGEN